MAKEVVFVRNPREMEELLKDIEAKLLRLESFNVRCLPSSQVEVEDVVLPERFIPEEIRNVMLEDREFLWDYAHATFTGDGMEIEHAAELCDGEDDECLLECYSSMCHNEKLGVVERLRALNSERINKILDEEN